MKDLVFREGIISLCDNKLENEFNEIVNSGGTAIYNVVTKFDIDSSGFDVSVTSFNNLEAAKDYLSKSFKCICDDWIKPDVKNEEEFNKIILELEGEDDLLLIPDDNYAYLCYRESYCTLYITVNNVHSELKKELNSNDNQIVTCSDSCEGFIKGSGLRKAEYCIQHCSIDTIKSLLEDEDMLNVFDSELNHTHCRWCGEILLSGESFVNLEFSKNGESRGYCNKACRNKDISENTEEHVLN